MAHSERGHPKAPDKAGKDTKPRFSKEQPEKAGRKGTRGRVALETDAMISRATSNAIGA